VKKASDKRALTPFFIVLGICSGLIAQTHDVSLQQLYERHSWFELRDALAGRSAPALYAGGVASAFNRTRDAETLLNRAVREASAINARNDLSICLSRQSGWDPTRAS
jgi:hypothetical protein